MYPHQCVLVCRIFLENDVTLCTFVRAAQRHESESASSAQRPLLTLLVLESSLLIVPRRCGPIPPAWSGRAQTKSLSKSEKGRVLRYINSADHPRSQDDQAQRKKHQ